MPRRRRRWSTICDNMRFNGFAQNFRRGTEVLEVVERRNCRRLVTRCCNWRGAYSHVDVDIVARVPGIVPFVPPVDASAFCGTFIHSSQLDEERVRDAVALGARVVVVGGGKSSHECVGIARGRPPCVSHPMRRFLAINVRAI